MSIEDCVVPKLTVYVDSMKDDPAQVASSMRICRGIRLDDVEYLAPTGRIATLDADASGAVLATITVFVRDVAFEERPAEDPHERVRRDALGPPRT